MNIVEFLKRKIDNIGTICAKYINENNEIEYLPIFYIAGSQTLPPPLEPAEEQKLINKLSEENNLEANKQEEKTDNEENNLPILHKDLKWYEKIKEKIIEFFDKIFHRKKKEGNTL